MSSNPPYFAKFMEFIDRVLSEKGHDIEFIVLYGSMAKGNWSLGSDYDVLIGLCVDDEKRFLDRLYDYSRLTTAAVDCFVYSKSELDQMIAGFHLTLLEALNHGIVLFDRGRWAMMQKQFQRWKTTKIIEQMPLGWQIRERTASPL